MFKLGSNSIKNLAGVDGRLVETVTLAITISPIDFGIPSTGGLRSEADQAQLFKDGVSKASGKEGSRSYHQSGKAVDLYAYVDGKASWDKAHLTIIATSMLQAAAHLGYPLKWGGLWKSWQDMPHYEIKD